MFKAHGMMQWIKVSAVIALLLYSIPRLGYILDVRYDAVVIKHLGQDDFLHSQWHQQHLAGNKPRAIKAAVSFLAALLLMITILPDARKKRKS